MEGKKTGLSDGNADSRANAIQKFCVEYLILGNAEYWRAVISTVLTLLVAYPKAACRQMANLSNRACVGNEA